ncbi:MAG TPA: PIN domain-containing protein [Spirochaetota bacterium]|nr:PIN domain-containing protein [Spirochaetota bacterium]HPJ40597.1 PIN domain-containing protein [Spirochaetota bacterium]
MGKQKKLILVDSNIIIDFWKKPTASSRKIFEDENIAVCGIIQAELIHGAKTDNELSRIVKALDELIFFDIDREDWIVIGKFLNKLRKKGITVPFQDAIIAYIAVKYDAYLWSNDQHFKIIQTNVKQLRLFQL